MTVHTWNCTQQIIPSAGQAAPPDAKVLPVSMAVCDLSHIELHPAKARPLAAADPNLEYPHPFGRVSPARVAPSGCSGCLTTDCQGNCCSLGHEARGALWSKYAKLRSRCVVAEQGGGGTDVLIFRKPHVKTCFLGGNETFFHKSSLNMSGRGSCHSVPTCMVWPVWLPPYGTPRMFVVRPFGHAKPVMRHTLHPGGAV